MSNEINQHPALKNFNEPLEMAKHVGGTALKGAAYGAVGLMALSFIVPIAPIVGILGGAAGLFGAGSATGAMMAVVVPALKIGATFGGLAGAVKSITGVEEAIAEKKMNIIADADMANMSAFKRQQMMQMAQQPNMQAAGGVAPNVGFGMGGKVNQQGQMVSQ